MTPISLRPQILTYAILLAGMCAAPSNAGVVLRAGAGDPGRAMVTSSSGGVERFDIGSLMDGLGWSSRWDAASGELTAARKGDTAVYFERLPFSRLNGRVCQLPWPPERRGKGLTLPVAALPPVLKWVGEDSARVTATGGQTTITVIRPDKPVSPPVDSAASPAPASPGVTTAPAHTVDTVAFVKMRPIDSATAKKLVTSTIVLDPGHGGADPGALGQNGTLEKDVTLAIALKVRDILKEKTGARVLMTRETDAYVTLQDRTRFANQKKADFFISIHANAVPGDSKRKNEARGYKVYFLSQAKNEDDKRVAAQENAVVEMEGDKASKDHVQNVIASLIVNEYLTESQDLSIALAETMGSEVDKLSKLNQGVGQANFWVLNGTRMPAVLIETAFISNLDEEKLLTSPAFQQKLAEAIVDAVVSFVKRYSGKQD